MRSVIFTLVCLLAVASAQAQSPVCVDGKCRKYTTSTAQGVAERMAAEGQVTHYGNPTGGYEGVGYSSISSEAAKRNCCFWGTRPVRDIGIARGRHGWYACARYR